MIDKEKFKEIRKGLNMSQDEFGAALDLSRNMIGMIERGDKKITSATEAKIRLLLQGQVNDNLVGIEKAPPGRFPKKTLPGRMVHFYDVDFAMGDIAFLDQGNDIVPAYTMDIPVFAGCTAFRGYSESMEPLIKSGAILFGTKVHEWNVHLEYGQIYGIICTDQRRYLKRVRKCKEDPKTFYTLESENPKYDPFEIPKECIKSVWLIHGWLNQKV